MQQPAEESDKGRGTAKWMPSSACMALLLEFSNQYLTACALLTSEPSPLFGTGMIVHSPSISGP